MPTESKGLTAQRIRKEKALASLRELQLAEREGSLVSAVEVEEHWSKLMIRVRDAVLGIAPRVALQFADPRRAEQVIRRECEAALRTLADGC